MVRASPIFQPYGIAYASLAGEAVTVVSRPEYVIINLGVNLFAKKKNDLPTGSHNTNKFKSSSPTLSFEITEN